MLRKPFASGVFASALALVLTVALPAQDGTARDTKEFAKALADHRYFDLAKEVLNAALTGTLSPDDQSVIEYELCEVTSDEGLSTSDKEKRQAALEESVKAYEKFIEKYPSSTVIAEARYQMTEILRTAGETVAGQVKDEKDATKKDQIREKGLNYFTKAEALATKRVEELKSKATKDENEQTEYKALRFAIPKIAYSKIQLFDERTGLNAQVALKTAKEGFEEFELDYPNELLTFEARRFLFLMAVDEKRLDEAEQLISYSCEQLHDAAVAQPDILTEDVTREVIITTYFEKAKFLTSTKTPADWKATIESLEGLHKIIPRLNSIREGRECLVILGRGYMAEGQTDKGKKLLTQVKDANPTDSAGIKADELLRGKGGGGVSASADIATLIAQLNGAAERKDYAQAEKLVFQVFARDPEKLKADDAAEALFIIGGIYFERNQFLDSSVAFEAIIDSYSATKRGPAAKMNAAMCYGRLAGVDKKAKDSSGFTFWKEKNKEAIADLIRRYPNSSEAGGVTYFAARDAEDEEKFTEAVDLYLKVPAGNVSYADAQFRAAGCAVKLGATADNFNKKDDAKKRYQQAMGALENAVTAFAKQAQETMNQQDKAKSNKGKLDSQMTLAQIYLLDHFKQVDKALALLDKAEEENKDDKAKVAQIWNYRVRAYVKQGKGRQAADLFRKFLESQKDTGAIAGTAVNVAGAVDKEALDKAKVNEKDPEVGVLFRTAAELYALAVDSASKGGANKLDWNLVGGRLLAIGGRLCGIADDLSMASIDVNAKLADIVFIEKAKRAYELAGDDRAGGSAVDRQRNIARCAALTLDWVGAIAALTDITSKHPLFDDKGALNKDQAKEVPQLAAINLDLAVAQIRAGKNDKSQYSTAIPTLKNLIRNSESGKRMYWEARYLYLLALQESGNFSELDAELDTLERMNPDADKNEYGIKARIEQIRSFRNRKPVITK